MKADIIKTKALDGSLVWELVVTSESNYESESLRWWSEQYEKSQGVLRAALVCEYPHNPQEKSAVNEVLREIVQRKDQAIQEQL